MLYVNCLRIKIPIAISDPDACVKKNSTDSQLLSRKIDFDLNI